MGRKSGKSHILKIPWKPKKVGEKKIYVNIIKTPFSEQSQPYEKSIYIKVNAVESSTFFLLCQKIRVKE